MTTPTPTTGTPATTNESPTPRCDAEACFPACVDDSDTMHPHGTHVCVFFARQLERELTAMTKELAEVRQRSIESGQMATALACQIGEPPLGSHPDEAKPRAATWHQERQNWQCEVERLRLHALDLRAQLAASEARASKLEEALRPFAGIIKWSGISESDPDDEAFLTGASNPVDSICGVRTKVLTVGDLRRAAALLQPSATGRGEG